ncbi:diguanylate cyclase [bacterium]|nr:diguanylate cyclase [bacterium]
MSAKKPKNPVWKNKDSDQTATKTAVETSPNANVQELLDEAAKKQPAMIVMQGENMGEVFNLQNGDFTIGRHPNCDISLNQRAVSGFHAVIRVSDSSVILEDTNSTNGTHLNKDKIERPAVLQAGDLVKVGSTVLRFVDSKLDAKFTESLHTQGTRDPLTGVFNKGHVLKSLDSSIDIARTGYSLCLIMLDIDHFKKINDTYGHIAGDFILKELCALIKELVRSEDVIGRFGGEEFVVTLPDSPLDVAAGIAERIRLTIEEHSFNFQDKKIPVTSSLGVSDWQPKYTNAEEFIEAVDKLLYKSKRNGRNKVTAPE